MQTWLYNGVRQPGFRFSLPSTRAPGNRLGYFTTPISHVNTMTATNWLPWRFSEIMYCLVRGHPPFLLPTSQENNEFCRFHDARNNTPIVEIRKPRRICGSSGWGWGMPRAWLRTSGPRWTMSAVTDGCSGLKGEHLSQMHWREQRAYWKHLGWGCPTGFSIWPQFQAFKLHWNICLLIDCCFNNKPMFVLLSTSNGRDPPHLKRGLFFGTFCCKAFERTEMVKRSRALIPSTVKETALVKGMRNRTTYS